MRTTTKAQSSTSNYCRR